MKKFKLSIFLILISTVLSFAQHADGLIGTYRLPNKLDIKIFSSNGKYYGKIVALNGFENGQTKDINNPDKSKRKNSLIGMTIIKGLKYDKKERQWLNGNMYGPEKGMKFNLKITELRKKEIVIVASKYFFWKTMEWKKI